MSIPRISCVRLHLRTLRSEMFPCMSNQLASDTSTMPQLWSCVEVSFSVISACLPSLTTLVLALLGKKPSSFRNNSVSFSRQRAEKKRVTDFGRITHVPDGDGSILVTHRVNQVTSKNLEHVRGAEQVGVVANATRSSV